MPNLADILKDPFTETTRKVRNHLMVAGLIGVLVADVGLIPSKVSALGIEFTGVEQANLLRLLFGVMIYYVVTFAIYSISELSASKLNEVNEKFDGASDEMQSNFVINLLGSKFGEYREFQELKSGALSGLRSFYEVLIPLAWGCYSAYAVYNVM
ncbi:TPA: hypothetical protein I7693_21930 [Vibrio vulnificus]|nr:hypothetical protein [Vibrio vulnificus]ELL0587642.1 hypothetical protein [Vibrio vulnificus]MCU8335272.1 hypothetical protein [Vibrio vulnificus]MCU8413346.1 hypothetical protein [Vibrio vulnificus]HAS8115927.1 hypothetical protein [Vibrio vulnificus]